MRDRQPSEIWDDEYPAVVADLTQLLRSFVNNPDVIKYGALSRGVWREYKTLLERTRESLAQLGVSTEGPPETD